MAERTRHGFGIDRDKLRALRLERIGTQAELALRAGITEGSVSRLESGMHVPHMATVIKIAKALRVKPRELLVFDPDMERWLNGEGAA